jgi:alkylhydroperoxidase/carboxymuconolactone decarboxylase family protein YurZ
MEGIKKEPTAALRQMATVMHQMHVALVDEGFTKEEALEIVMHVLAMQTGSAEE